MKRNYLLLVCLLGTLTGFAQLNIQSGATFFIQSGATVTVQGDVTSNSNIQGTGLLQLKGTSVQNFNLNGNSIANLEVDNTSNITFGGGAVVTNSLLFTNGKLQIGNNNLTLESAATITGADATKYVVTNGTGQLVKNSLSTTAFTYPVGYDATTYNPVTVAENGTTDNIGVRVLQKVQLNGSTGENMVKEVVDASWLITDATPGGNNLSITGTWAATDELTGFVRSKTGLSNYNGTNWDLTNAQTGAASGTGPYTISRSNITSTGAFAVGNRPVLSPLLVAPKVFLQGAYTSGTLMNDKLRTDGVIPTSEPYTALSSFSHLGSGGSETIPSAKLLGGTSNNTSIVDWVFASLHRSSDGAVIATRSVLLRRDGNVIDLDGRDTLVGYVNFAGEVPGNYYISIRHRNHLGVRSASTIALNATSAASYDFTTAQAQAYQNPAILTNAAMGIAFNGTTYVMWAGNINQDQYVRVTSQALPPIASDAAYLLGTVLGGNPNGNSIGYVLGDVNMDGRARATSQALPPLASDIAYILGTVMGGTPNATRREHR